MFLGWVRTAAAAGKPDTRGVWKRQDGQEWQLFTLCELFILSVHQSINVFESGRNLANNTQVSNQVSVDLYSAITYVNTSNALKQNAVIKQTDVSLDLIKTGPAQQLDCTDSSYESELQTVWVCRSEV